MTDESRVRHRRLSITLDLKIHILDLLKSGKKISHVAKFLDLNEATIRTIQKNEQKIRASVAAGCSLSASMMARQRAPIIEKMEKVLCVWINESSSRRIPLDAYIIKQTAVKIYNHLKENGESSAKSDFVASKGWFDRFKRRFSLRYRGKARWKIKGTSAATNYKADETCLNEAQKVLEELGNDIFKSDDINLLRSKLLKKTCIANKEIATPELKVCSHIVAEKINLLFYICGCLW